MQIESINDAEVFLKSAPSGTNAEYYRGNLWAARQAAGRNSVALNLIADMMLGCSGAHMPREKARYKASKRVDLYQIRHGDCDYSYMARRV